MIPSNLTHYITCFLLSHSFYYSVSRILKRFFPLRKPNNSRFCLNRIKKLHLASVEGLKNISSFIYHTWNGMTSKYKNFFLLFLIIAVNYYFIFLPRDQHCRIFFFFRNKKDFLLCVFARTFFGSFFSGWLMTFMTSSLA